MKIKDLENQIKVLFQQLTLINNYYEHFENILGHKGVEEYTDDILDKINTKRKQVKKLKNKNS